MKMVTIKIIRIDKDKLKLTGLEIGKDINNNTIDIPINKSIYLGMLAEMNKANILVDDELKCFDNRIFTIIEKEWKQRILNPPKTFCVALRKDIEKMI